MNMEINRFKVETKERKKRLYFYFPEEEKYIRKKHIWTRYKPSNLLRFEFIENNDLKTRIEGLKRENIEEEPFIYISFFDESSDNIEIDLYKNKIFLKKWLKEVVIQKLIDNYIIEPYREGCDLSIYKAKEILNENIQRYNRYDFNFHIFGEKPEIELSVSIGSRDTYIGKPSTNIEIINTKVVVDNLLIKKENGFDTSLVKFNRELRKKHNIISKPIQQFYKEDYDEIKKFIEEISNLLKDEIIIYSSFIKKSENEIKLVDFENNKMIFRDNQKDYSAINGMRDYGPYKIPDNIVNTQLLFIYPDSECANKLAKYFSRGFRHFPGLESYVGIPANFSGIKINYENNLNNIIELINQKLPDFTYENLLAICIMPFSKSTATDNESNIYYQIKKILLEKGIPSQFIHRDKIFQENFHFSLPNIAIAMLAKIGGIPWKLSRKHFKQLTIGFNIFKKESNLYLGSTVYFDNEGILQNIDFSTSNSIDAIVNHLSNAINKFKNENNSIENLVIHFYKPLNEKENKQIEKSLTNSFGNNLAFCVVEINDTKTSTDLCFDLEYQRYMPQSGIYVKLKPNEYLLFNNLRYWEQPQNPIRQEEYPVKLKIYDPSKSFNHHELISQVYEFSRLYWKSLKQKAQPVTTIYSKLVAEYMANFGLEDIPDNKVAKNTVWFV